MDKEKVAYIYAAVLLELSFLTLSILPYLLNKPLWGIWTVVGLIGLIGVDYGSTRRIEKWDNFGGKVDE